MIEKKRTRRFHAGKLRKTVGGIEFVEVAESKGKVFVSEDGRIITGVHLSDISYAASGKLKTAGGYVWKVVKYV